MKALLVNPENPATFWSYKYALPFISKKALLPPLGLLTVAAMLDATWDKRLVDMNVAALRDDDLRWADCVFIGAMSIQKKSALDVIRRCRETGVRTVAGGPLFTTSPDEFGQVDHLVLGEAEVTLPRFLEDLGRNSARHRYEPRAWADMSATPLPPWELSDMRAYMVMSIQYSRGCPFECDFCDVTLLNGRSPRSKSTGQIIAELENLYRHGWRGDVFFVDDNFVAYKIKLKEDVLPAITRWMKLRRYPFAFNTQASITMADDRELMGMMASAGFQSVFIGIETPHKESLHECAKHHNRQRDLLASVRAIQRHGFEVQGGFIVGFDSDPDSIFDAQIRFIQQSGIVTAMVGLLNAFPGTRLYQRLRKENRLLGDVSGDNTDCSINFKPKMDPAALVNGYKRVVKSIYSPAYYYARVRQFLSERVKAGGGAPKISLAHVRALFKVLFVLGIREKERFHFWKLILWTLLRKPRAFPHAAIFAATGFHHRKKAGLL